MKTSSRSDLLRSWLLTLFAWEPVMCRMWQGSSGEGMSLGSSGVHASLSWMARVEGPAQPGFLTLSKYFLCWSFNDLVWSPLITHLIWCSVFLLSFKIWSNIVCRASCASSRLYYFLLLCVWQPWNTWKSNWAGPSLLQAKAPSFLPLFLVHTVCTAFLSWSLGLCCSLYQCSFSCDAQTGSDGPRVRWTIQTGTLPRNKLTLL